MASARRPRGTSRLTVLLLGVAALALGGCESVGAPLQDSRLRAQLIRPVPPPEAAAAAGGSAAGPVVGTNVGAGGTIVCQPGDAPPLRTGDVLVATFTITRLRPGGQGPIVGFVNPRPPGWAAQADSGPAIAATNFGWYVGPPRRSFFSGPAGAREYQAYVARTAEGAAYFMSAAESMPFAAPPRASLLILDETVPEAGALPVISAWDEPVQLKGCGVVRGVAQWSTAAALAHVQDSLGAARGVSGAPSAPSQRPEWRAYAGSFAPERGALATSGADALALTTVPTSSLVEAVFTAPASGRVQAGVVADADPAAPSGGPHVRCTLGSGGATLSRVEPGRPAEMLANTGIVAAQPGGTYRVALQFGGDEVRCLVDGSAVGAARYRRAGRPGAGLWRAAGVGFDETGPLFQSFTAWPAEVALPPEVLAQSKLYAPPAMGRPRTIELAGPEGARLHDPAGTGWFEASGRWEYRDGRVVRMGHGGHDSYVLRDTGCADGTWEVDLRTSPGVRSDSGLVFRFVDRQNFMYARIITNLPTWEVELAEWRAGRFAIVRFNPITSTTLPYPSLVNFNEDHRLSVKAVGPWVTAYLDGFPRLTFEQPPGGPMGRLAGPYSLDVDTGTQFKRWTEACVAR